MNVRASEVKEIRMSREAALDFSPRRKPGFGFTEKQPSQGSERVNELQGSTFPSLPRRGGRAIKKMVPFRRGADGVVNLKLCFGMRSERCRVIDHYLCFALSRSRCAPVCGVAVASRLLIDAAAIPPCQGGEYARF